MSKRSKTIEDCLKHEIRRWLSRALNDALALPTAATVHEWDRAGLVVALRGVRDAIEAVRLYASGCFEVANAPHITVSTERLADLAVQICEQLDEEVNQLESGILTYAR